MLNALQKQILEATLQVWLEDIAELADKKLAITGFKAITDETLFNEHRAAFEQADILGSIESLRQLYQHPCPQNRAIGSPYVGQEEGLVVWQDPITKAIKKEPKGLLGLTAQNEPHQILSKEDVINYIELLRKDYLLALQEESLHQQQVQVEQLTQQINQVNNTNVNNHNNAQSPNFFQAAPAELWAQAQQHYQQKQAYEALGYLNHLVHMQPQNAEYRFLRAQCFVALKRREEALVDFNCAIKQRPLHEQTWVERGFTLENIGNFEGALRDYQQALQINPDHAFALTRKAGLTLYQGKLEEAQQDYQRALELKPEDPSIYINRGEQYLWLERYPEAIADFNEAIRLRPQWQDVQAMKAEAERLLAKAAQEQAQEHDIARQSSQRRCVIA